MKLALFIVLFIVLCLLAVPAFAEPLQINVAKQIAIQATTPAQRPPRCGADVVRVTFGAKRTSRYVARFTYNLAQKRVTITPTTRIMCSGYEGRRK